MIERSKILRLIRENRYDIDGLKETFDRKIFAFLRWLYENLSLGPRWERALERRVRKAPTTPEKVEILRPVIERLSDVVRAGRASAHGYARMIVREFDLARKIGELDTVIPKIKDDLELLKVVISLKEEREIPFIEYLLRDLLTYLPVETRGIAETERVLRLVRKRLEELREMIPTKLEVDTEPVKGEVFVDGVSWGTAPQARDVRPRTYRVSFGPVEGYRTPEPITVEVKLHEIKRVVGRYEPIVPPPITRVLQSRMYYRSYLYKDTPDPFAFLVAFAKTREPEKYTEEFFKAALDYLQDEVFYTLGGALTHIDPKAALKGLFPLAPARGGAHYGVYKAGKFLYFVDGREVRAVDMDEVEEEAKKLKLTVEEMLEQIRYYAAFYVIRAGVPRIYREYVGSIAFVKGRWVIYPELEKTKYEPRETMMPEAPRPEELEK